MKRQLIAILLTVAMSGWAEIRTEQDAMNIALAFFQSQDKLKSATQAESMTLTYACTNLLRTDSEKVPYYYVFNYGDNKGFVIISGNDRAKTILGYSGQGCFAIDDLPENFRNWLLNYQEEIEYLYQLPENIPSVSDNYALAQNSAAFATAVSPLLKNTFWNQYSPYNDMCPIISASYEGQRAVTGCVATAIAQIMYLHKWPTAGTGSISYVTKTRKLPINVNFENTAYDWGNMTPYYNSSSTQVQKNAVATLMYHCGAAVKMDYDESSAAYSNDAATALIKNFGYDANLQYFERKYFSISEWINILKTELNASRPVYYSGSSSEEGHAFVCDGYDANNLFHFNWGWGGSSNGYFELTALNPGTRDGYNASQTMVAGIQKPTASSKPFYVFSLESMSTNVASISPTGLFSITGTGIYNIGIKAFSGKVGFAIFDNHNNFVRTIVTTNTATLEPFFGYSSLNAKDVKMPNNIPAGNYKIYCIALYNNDRDIVFTRKVNGLPNYLNMTVTATAITFSTPDFQSDLALSDVATIGNIYQNKTGRFNVTIKNNGDEYNALLRLRLVSSTNSNIYQDVVSGDLIHMASGETKTIETAGQVTLGAGNYNLYVYYDKNNNSNPQAPYFVQLGDPIAVNILAPPLGTPDLQFISTPAFADAENVNIFDAVLTATIKNTGSYFENSMIVGVYPLSLGSAIASFGYQTLFLDTDEEKTVDFKGMLLELNPGTYYYAIMYYNDDLGWKEFGPNSNNHRIKFKVTDTPTGIHPIKQTESGLYPNPVTDRLFLKSEDRIKSVKVYEIFGKIIISFNPGIDGEISIPVENLTAGSYLLQAETDKGVKNYKFIKK
jgi:hypothetical protein